MSERALRRRERESDRVRWPSTAAAVVAHSLLLPSPTPHHGRGPTKLFCHTGPLLLLLAAAAPHGTEDRSTKFTTQIDDQHGRRTPWSNCRTADRTMTTADVFYARTTIADPQSNRWPPPPPPENHDCVRRHSRDHRRARPHHVFGCLGWSTQAMELRVGNKYRLGRKIGSGSFGDIYLGELRWSRPRRAQVASVHCYATTSRPRTVSWRTLVRRPFNDDGEFVSVRCSDVFPASSSSVARTADHRRLLCPVRGSSQTQRTAGRWFGFYNVRHHGCHQSPVLTYLHLYSIVDSRCREQSNSWFTVCPRICSKLFLGKTLHRQISTYSKTGVFIFAFWHKLFCR